MFGTDSQGLVSEKKLCYLPGYLKNKQVVIVNQGSEISDLSDLKGKIVCVQKGPTGYDALKRGNISSKFRRLLNLKIWLIV